MIIWLTDNVPNVPDNSVHSEAETLGLLRETGVVVCTLMERSAMSREMGVVYSQNPFFVPMRMMHPPGDVNKYADQSGGLVIGARREEVADKLADLIDRIRSRYTLGYTPAQTKPEGELYKIDVKLTPEAIRKLGIKTGDIAIRARRGYQR